jgi:hypothetical protein
MEYVSTWHEQSRHDLRLADITSTDRNQYYTGHDYVVQAARLRETRVALEIAEQANPINWYHQ